MGDLALRGEMRFAYGAAEPVSPLIRRLVARNPGPFTLHGTGTYIVGRGRVAVIDPGPDLPEHVEALLAALAGERVAAILVTHTHRDHSPAAAALRAATGAPTCGYGPHAGGRASGDPGSEAGADYAFVPDRALGDGDAVEGPGWRLRAVHTPGHTSNHLCFALAEESALFSGDHVMGWSTSVIAPPDGDMGDYLRSLELLLARDDAVYWPTHGPPIAEPRRLVRGFIAHRRAREAAIRRRLEAGDGEIAAIVAAIYVGLAPALRPAAARSVLAHLIELIRRGEAACDGEPTLAARYRPR